MENIKPINKHQLKNLVRDCRSLINNYMIENDLTVHACSKKCGVHPAQLHLFLDSKRGLNLTTMQKIADVISK